MRGKAITAPDLVRQMAGAGAVFMFTDCGSLLVRGLAGIPEALRQTFFDIEHPRELVEAVRAMREAGPVEDEPK